MIKKIIKFPISFLYYFLMHPKRRYKFIFLFNNLFAFNKKEQILLDAFNFVNFAKLDGDYLEFGVWKGTSLITAFHMSKRMPNLSNIRFYGFDSFEGLPAIKDIDGHFTDFNSGEYSCSLENVKNNLINSAVDLGKVRLIKGWYKDTLNIDTAKTLDIKHAAIIYVDCDLYDSAKDVLNFITPYVMDGTIIIFDDWYCFKGRSDSGEQRAFSEWLACNANFTAVPYKQFGYVGYSFIINKS